MRIYKMTATFGKLERAELTLEPGLNLIEAPNEWGKSTWCAFLLAMLYGLDTRAKSTRTALADKERYAPWSGAPMSGRIDLNWRGRDITIERTTRGRIPMGQFRAYETATGLAVPELDAHNCGQALLGVERSVFQRSAFLRLADLPVTQDEALRRRLNALVTTGDESGEGERLARELKDLRNRIRYNRSGLLPQAEEELGALEETLSELKNLEDRCAEVEGQLSETKEALRRLENHKIVLVHNRAAAARERQSRAREEWLRAAGRVKSLEKECEELPGRAEAEEKSNRLRRLMEEREDKSRVSAPEEPERRPFAGLTGPEALEQAHTDGAAFVRLRRKGLWFWWLLTVLLLAVAVAVFVWKGWVFGLAVLALGLLPLGIGIRGSITLRQKREDYIRKYGSADPEAWLLLARNHARKQEDHQLRQQTLCGSRTPEEALAYWQRVLDSRSALEEARREEKQAEALFRALEETAPAPLPPAEADSLTLSAEETEALLARKREEQRRLSALLGKHQGRMEALGTRQKLTGDRDRLRARIRALEETYEALNLGLETLRQARQELQRRFAPRITARAAEYLERLTSGRYDRLTLNEDFSLLAAARQETVLQSALWRSEGTVDQLYVALRLAVAEELTPRAPLILDDALVRFDDERLKAALEILKEISESRQVILFTCQSREKQML